MKITGKTNIKNRFDIECKDIRTGEVQKFQAHNIVLDQMWSRLVNFQTYFTNIHFGTGTGTLNPARTSLFAHLGTKAATNVSRTRALPTSSWMRQIVLMPEEYVGKDITEVGIAYGSTTSYLVTHAFLEDSEGNPISITKTDTMVVTIYATIFFELGELEDMYGGQFRWVMPASNNELINYLTGVASYPAQRFMVTQAGGFATDGYHEGCAPTRHGQSADITPTNWIKDSAAKKATTPKMRLGINDGNDAIRGIGLGSTNDKGTFRGQLPIAGVFAGHEIEGEAVGIGDGEAVGFNPAWPYANISAVYVDGVLVDPADYTLGPTKKGTNIFLFRQPVVLAGSITTGSGRDLTNGQEGYDVINMSEDCVLGIDAGAVAPSALSAKLRIAFTGGTDKIALRGTNNPDFSGSVFLAEVQGSYMQEADFESPGYRYYRVETSQGRPQLREVYLLTADNQITFTAPPAEGAIITADYTVDYIPKDENHVLDLQVSIQYGEGA